MSRSLGEVPWAEGEPQGREELAWLRGEEGQGGESREGVGRTPEDSRWLSQGCARDFSRRLAGGPSGGVCVHVSGGGHVSEDMCPFLEAERGFPTQRGEKAGALGRATGEAGGGGPCPEPLVLWSGSSGKMRGQAGLNVRNGAWEQSRGDQGARGA